MKNFKKNSSHFDHVCALLTLAFLLLACSESHTNFTDFLYKLAEIDEQNRGQYLEKWIKSQEEFPVIDNNDVYFLYKEKRELSIFLTGDMNKQNLKKIQLMKIIGTDYYYTKQTFPLNSAFEYKFLIHGKFIPDPLNKKFFNDTNGKNSLLFMPEYHYPLESLTRIHKIYTKLDTLKFNDNPVYCYHPLNVKNDAPIIFFYNGQKYLHYAEANVLLDNLISDNKIQPCIAVFLMDSVPLNRLISFLKTKYNLSDNPVIIGGNKKTGQTSLQLIKNSSMNITGIFGQSVLTEDLSFLDDLPDIDLAGKKIFLSYGYYENKDSVYTKLKNLLTNKVSYFKIERYNEGASWLSWKSHLDDALIYLLKSENTKNDHG